MLLRHGAVVAEGWWAPYAPELRHMLFSLSKSYTAMGFAVAEACSPSMIRYFRCSPASSLQRMSVKIWPHNEGPPPAFDEHGPSAEDTTGRLFEARGWQVGQAFLALPVEYEPGTHFLYNTGATYVLAAIVQKLTGMALIDYLTQLFEPLGIKDAWWGSLA